MVKSTYSLGYTMPKNFSNTIENQKLSYQGTINLIGYIFVDLVFMITCRVIPENLLLLWGVSFNRFKIY